LPSIADQDYPEWFHHPRVPGQVDAADQVCGHDAVGGVGTVPGQGGALRARGLLLGQCLVLHLPQVRQQRGQETRGTTQT